MSVNRSKFSRRKFLQSSVLLSGAVLLASCGGKETETPAVVSEGEQSASEALTMYEPVDSVPQGAVDWDFYPATDGRRYVVFQPVEPLKKYSNLKISQNMVHWGSAYKAGETAVDNVSSRYMKEVMGLEFEVKWEDATGDGTQWATALASGDLPELMCELPGSYYAQLLEADMLMDVKEIFERTASPLYKELVGYPHMPSWQYLKHGDGYYGIAGSWGPPFNVYDLLWVRQDWLDQVGMQFPTTLDEVAAVARAFLDAGLATIGISGAANLTQWGAFSAYFAAFGRVPFQWKLGPDGSLFYTSTDPTVKQGLALLADWYKQGLLEPDFVKRAGMDSMGALNENCVSGKAGITACPFWGASMLQSMKGSQPEVQWAWGDPPMGPAGKKGSATFTNAGQINAFLKGTDPTKVEAVINQVNLILAMADASRIGGGYQQILMWEGYDYILDDSSGVTFGSFPTTYIGGGGLNATFQPEGILGMQAKRKLALLEADPDGEFMNPVEKLNCLDDLGVSALAIPASVRAAEDEPKYGERGDFIWSTPSELNEIGAIIGPQMQETFFSIITNKLPVDAWDAWVVDWKANGGDILTEGYNTIYKEKTQG